MLEEQVCSAYFHSPFLLLTQGNYDQKLNKVLVFVLFCFKYSEQLPQED